MNSADKAYRWITAAILKLHQERSSMDQAELSVYCQEKRNRFSELTRTTGEGCSAAEAQKFFRALEVKDEQVKVLSDAATQLMWRAFNALGADRPSAELAIHCVRLAWEQIRNGVRNEVKNPNEVNP